jgi:hypothetical protein
MTAEDRKLIGEIADRARRIETRVTKVANHLGIDAGGEKPQLRGNMLFIPSLKVSLQDIIDVIGNTSEAIAIHCGDDYLVTVER